MRTFIAVALNENLKEVIRKIQDDFKLLPCDIKWVKPQNAHLTIKFLGNIDAEQLETIKENLPRVVKDFHPIDTELTCLGAFPKIERPRVIWMGLKDTEQKIETLAQSTEKALSQIGFESEERSFRSHITLGRIRSGKNTLLLSEKLKKYSLPQGMTQTVETLILFKSTLTPQGPIYEVLEEFVFGT